MHYQGLIQRRENLIEKIRGIETGWVESLPKLYQNRLQDLFGDNVSTLRIINKESESTPGYFYGFKPLGGGWWIGHYTDSIANAEEIEEAKDNELLRGLDKLIKSKEKQVKYELRRFDSEWMAEVRNLWRTEKQLREFYQSHLENSPNQYETKKAKIKELKRSFPYLRGNQSFLARCVDSSYSYVNQFDFDGENFINKKIPKHIKRRTREKDNYQCVRCGSDNSLQIHHIIPLARGGAHELENLATLCKNCHRLAHKGRPNENGEIWGMKYSQTVYESENEFWNDWTET